MGSQTWNPLVEFEEVDVKTKTLRNMRQKNDIP